MSARIALNSALPEVTYVDAIRHPQMKTYIRILKNVLDNMHASFATQYGRGADKMGQDLEDIEARINFVLAEPPEKQDQNLLAVLRADYKKVAATQLIYLALEQVVLEQTRPHHGQLDRHTQTGKIVQWWENQGVLPEAELKAASRKLAETVKDMKCPDCGSKLAVGYIPRYKRPILVCRSPECSDKMVKYELVNMKEAATKFATPDETVIYNLKIKQYLPVAIKIVEDTNPADIRLWSKKGDEQRVIKNTLTTQLQWEQEKGADADRAKIKALMSDIANADVLEVVFGALSVLADEQQHLQRGNNHVLDRHSELGKVISQWEKHPAFKAVNRYQTQRAASTRKTAGHWFDGKHWYVDTDFINKVQHAYPGATLRHLGFGEFVLETPEGQIDFDRMRGKEFPGQDGRSHQIYDNKGGKVVEKAIHLMEQSGKSVRVAAIKFKIKEGDEVQFTAAFLRSTGQYTGDAPHAKGRVKKITTHGGLTLAEVDWNVPGMHPTVNAANLKPVKTPEPY